MHSAIYKGWIHHRRFEPIAHAFRYRLFMVYLDLAELPDVFDGIPFWSARHPDLAYLRRADHLGDVGVPLDQAVRELVAERTGSAPAGPIRLLTHLRYFGICFNPISLYYCFDEADTRLETTVAEVHNTPWLEEHCYVLDPDSDMGVAPWHRYRIRKEFHVSPFMDMDMEYDWRFTDPGQQLSVRIRDYRNETKVFGASMKLNRLPLTPSTLTRAMLRYPIMTLKVILAIQWQALKLWRKGAQFYPHPRKRKPAMRDRGNDV